MENILIESNHLKKNFCSGSCLLIVLFACKLSLLIKSAANCYSAISTAITQYDNITGRLFERVPPSFLPCDFWELSSNYSLVCLSLYYIPGASFQIAFFQ